MTTPRHDLALEFLRKFHPERRWVLTSIDPDDSKKIQTRTFGESTASQMMSWLSEMNVTGRRGIYFSVNEPTRDLSSKASKEDMARAWVLHVDVDPRAGEDFQKEQVRTLGVAQSPPAPIPPPTIIIFSGGGHQAIWKLDKPVEINGSESAARELELYNIFIELQMGGDHCHNVDRILRLPGTINWPKESKRKRGQQPALAELVEWHEDRVYSLSQFTKAPPTQKAGNAAFNPAGVQVSGNIPHLSTPDDLPKTVSDKIKVIIAQGSDPEDPNRFPSRSEWLWLVLCSLYRVSLDDDTVYSVITNPAFGISASVLDKGSSAEKYALAQMAKAKEEAEDSDLRAMNEKHAVIGNWGGKCLVIEEIYDDVLKRYRITKSSFSAIRDRYMNQYKMVKGPNDQLVPKPLGHWWLAHTRRKQFDTLVFAPGKEIKGAYNLWRGFACEPRPGDCSLYLSHMKNVICSGNEEHYEYLLSWMARAVQEPDAPGLSAVVLKGGMGTGKGFFVKTFGSLFGRHFMQVTDPKHLVGSFNAHLRDVVVLFGDEAFYAGDKKHESILKMLVTEEMLTIEAKGIDAEASANCVHLLMASNEDWVVPVSVDDRRFFILDVSSEHQEDHEYFESMSRQVEQGGREALLHILMTRDITNFNVRKIVHTDASRGQKVHSFTPEEEWWYTKLRDGRIREGDPRWVQEVACVDLTNDFLSYAKGFGVFRRGNRTKLETSLVNFCPEVKGPYPAASTIEVTTMDGTKKHLQNPLCWRFPSLTTCRKLWDENYGGPYEWPEIPPEQGHLNGAADYVENAF